jgi:hypothetical protein
MMRAKVPLPSEVTPGGAHSGHLDHSFRSNWISHSGVLDQASVVVQFVIGA